MSFSDVYKSQTSRGNPSPHPSRTTAASSSSSSLSSSPRGGAGAQHPPSSVPANNPAISVADVGQHDAENRRKEAMSLCQRTSTTLFQVSTNTTSLQRHVEWVGTSNDTPQTRKNIQDLIEKTRDSLRQATDQVKACPSPTSSSTAPASVQNSSERAYRLTYQKVQKDLKDITSRFQSVSRAALQKCRDVVLPTATLVSIERVTDRNYTTDAQPYPSYLDHRDDGDDQGEDTPLLQYNPLLQQPNPESHVDEADIQYNEALIQERDRDLASIETSLLEVNQIFRDLGTIVHEQQYVIDNIEEHVSAVSVHMEGATEQLRQADKRQRWRKSWMCWILGMMSVAFVVILLLVLIFKPLPAAAPPVTPLPPSTSNPPTFT